MQLSHLRLAKQAGPWRTRDRECGVLQFLPGVGDSGRPVRKRKRSMRYTTKLSIAIGSVLNISSRSGHRLNARVLGMFEGGSIIAHIPGAVYTDLIEGDEVAVRYLAGRTAYGFKATVLRRCTS